MSEKSKDPTAKASSSGVSTSETSETRMFMSNVPLPQPLNTEGNLALNWKKWKQVWSAYETVTGLKQRESSFRVATFITCIGSSALEIHNGLPFKTDEEKDDIEVVMKLWQDHCVGKTNVIYERYKFNNRVQKEHESVEQYVTALRSLASTCEFGNLKDDMIRDKIVCGIRSDSIRTKLLQESKLTLERCISLARSAETSKTQVKEITSGNNDDKVNKVDHKQSRRQFQKALPKPQICQECLFCGKSHERDRNKCPAFGKTCTKCRKQNHFARCCNSYASSSHKVHEICDESSSEEELFNVTLGETDGENNTYEVRNNFGKKLFATMLIEDKQVRMQIDSGASCNILPKKFVPANAFITETDKELVTFCKSKIKAIGVSKVSFRNAKNNKKYRAEFVIVDGDYTPIIGARAAQQMRLIVVNNENILQVNPTVAPNSKEQILQQYHDVFGGLGKMEGKLHLVTDPSAQPAVMPPRRVPLVTKGKLKEELQRLEKLGVIAKQEAPTDWVSSLVVTSKTDGRVRVCIDPLHLNKALKRPHYPLPVIEEIFPDLADAKVFTKVDLKDGFLQVELDDESSELTTFQTPWGRYRYLRMPFGITPAPEYFQQKLDQNLEGLKGTFKIADDILVIGQGDDPSKDHDQNLQNLLDRCRSRNIKLNKSKFHYKCDSIPFIGHVLTKDGLKPDPSKIDAITNMERPADVEAVRRLIGMVKYLSKFLPDLSTASEPLRRLTHKDTVFQWNGEQEQAFLNVKELVSQAPLLKYFDSKEPIEGQGDASSTGLGFALMQNGQPVTFASRALTAAERNYPQIEKELLALVYGLEHNHQYVYGRPIKLWTDHKPLVAIYKKPLATAPKRLQRLLLRMQQYDVTIEYLPGTQMYVADTLSRAHQANTGERSKAEQETEHVHIAQFLAISEPQLKEIQHETSGDKTLQLLIRTIKTGWPETKAQVPMEIHPYYNIRDELSTNDGVVLKGQRCIIPASLRPKIRTKIHASHTGIQSCLRRARELIYWPGMNNDLTDYISQCEICASQQNAQSKEPMITHEQPSRPWEKIATDIFTFDGKDYLCTVDYYSDYFEVDPINRKTGEVIINKLKKHFATHGIPVTIYTDNGPPFNSQEFSSFAEKYEFEHKTSSPHYPQSNGKAENAVKTAKHLLKKSIKAKNDYNLVLLDWRNTPTEGLNSSPAQRLFGRRTRTLLPSTANLLKPKVVEVITKKESIRSKRQKYYNGHTKELPPLRNGDVVRVALDPNGKDKKWTKAEVKKEVSPRSYKVETNAGIVYRRNRRHIRVTGETKPTPELLADIPDDIEETADVQAQAEILNHDTAPEDEQTEMTLRRSARISRPPSYLKDYVTY